MVVCRIFLPDVALRLGDRFSANDTHARGLIGAGQKGQNAHTTVHFPPEVQKDRRLLGLGVLKHGAVLLLQPDLHVARDRKTLCTRHPTAAFDHPHGEHGLSHSCIQ